MVMRGNLLMHVLVMIEPFSIVRFIDNKSKLLNSLLGYQNDYGACSHRLVPAHMHLTAWRKELLAESRLAFGARRNLSSRVFT